MLCGNMQCGLHNCSQLCSLPLMERCTLFMVAIAKAFEISLHAE